MANYVATISFEDDRLGNIKRGAKVELSPQIAERYVKAKLIKLQGSVGGLSKPNPIKAAGTQSSASPAAPVSPQKIVKKQRSGSRKKKGAQSS